MDIMKELAEIIGLGTDDLKKIISDGTLKVAHNGEPIVDIENGVDKLAPKKDEPKKNEPKKEPYVPPVVETPCTCKTQSCTCPETTVTYNTWLNKGLLMVNPDEFIVIDEVAGHLLADSQTEITFAHVTDDGWVSGITNNQLLAILCERFKKEPKKVEILKVLMNS